MDKTYWESYYQTHRQSEGHSRFAACVLHEWLMPKNTQTQSADSKQACAQNIQIESKAESSLVPKQTKQDMPIKQAKKASQTSHSAQATHINQAGQKHEAGQKIKKQEAQEASQTLSLLELGCGNGRDSLFFAAEGVRVEAIDQTKEQIDFLNSHAPDSAYAHAPRFIAGDFTRLDSLELSPPYDCVYSRFTLHSVDKASQNRTLQDSLALLKNGGLLAIEVRGKRNALYGRGEPHRLSNGEIEEGAFIYDNHYRRFLDFEQTCKEIESLAIPHSANTAGGGGGM